MLDAAASHTGWVYACAAALILAAAPARAESIRDRVRSHLDENLEQKPREKQRRRKAPQRRARRPPPPQPRPAASEPAGAPASPEPPPPAEPEGPKLPYRVIGRDLQLDPKLGGGFRGWHMQQYPSVDVSARGYFTWSVEMKARFFRTVNLHRGYYESSGLSGPRRSGAVVAQQIGKAAPHAAWLLGMIGVPITRAWEPVIRYEARTFRTTATPKRPVRIVPHETSADADLTTIPPTTEELSMVSSFETLVAGMRYDHSKDPSGVIDTGKGNPIPPFYFGVGLTAYSKPYQVTVGDAVLDDVLFDARFRGAGLAFGLNTKEKPDWFFVSLDGQLGLGEVLLLEDLSLNELLPKAEGRSGLQPPEWLIGYLQGDVTAGYLLPLLRTMPTLLLSLSATAGGATFFYFKTQVEEGETVDAPPLNWDLLWGARAALILPL